MAKKLLIWFLLIGFASNTSADLFKMETYGFEICNRTGSDISIAKVWEKNTGFGGLGPVKYISGGWWNVPHRSCHIHHDIVRDKHAWLSIWKDGKLFPDPIESKWSKYKMFGAGSGYGYRRIDGYWCTINEAFERTSWNVEDHYQNCPSGYVSTQFNLQIYVDYAAGRLRLTLHPDKIEQLTNF